MHILCVLLCNLRLVMYQVTSCRPAMISLGSLTPIRWLWRGSLLMVTPKSPNLQLVTGRVVRPVWHLPLNHDLFIAAIFCHCVVCCSRSFFIRHYRYTDWPRWTWHFQPSSTCHPSFPVLKSCLYQFFGFTHPRSASSSETPDWLPWQWDQQPKSSSPRKGLHCSLSPWWRAPVSR